MFGELTSGTSMPIEAHATAMAFSSSSSESEVTLLSLLSLSLSTGGGAEVFAEAPARIGADISYGKGTKVSAT